MAKILFGDTVVDKRGKQGGTVYSKNGSCSYTRNKVSPVNPQSTQQTVVRNRLTGYTQGWRGLTDAQRLQWNNAVIDYKRTNQFGQQYELTGQTLYVSLNANLNNVGATALSEPAMPTAITPVASASATAAKGTPAMSLTFTPSPITALHSWLIDATPGVSAGKSFLKPIYKQIAVLAPAATSPQNLLTAYTTIYGAIPAAGSKIGIRITPVHRTTGQQGGSYEITLIVGA
jgi:hypothetical protein